MNGLERRIPKRWTEAEDNILYHEAKIQSGQVKDWNRIAAKLPGRTNKDCRKRWINKVCGSLKKGSWEEEEDERLREAVRIHGQKWTVIANFVGLRSPDQCAKRWQYNLDPRLEHGAWSAEEDELLVNLVQNHGREWKFIQGLGFPTRSRNELRNRYTTLSKKANLNGENNGSTCSSSGDSPALEDTGPGDANPASETLDIDTGEEIQDYTSGCTQMQWEETQNDETMAVNTWIDPADGDWLSHLGATAAGSPPAIKDASAQEPATAPENLICRPRPEALTDICVEVTKAMNTNSGSRWSDSIDMSDQSDFAQIETAGSEWASSTGNLLTVGSLHEDPLTLIGDNHESGNQSFESLAELAAAAQVDLVGKVSLVVDHCDRDTLNYLLDMSRELKGKVKVKIDM